MGVFRVVLEMEVASDHVEQFEQAWLETAWSFRSAPGILAQTLATNTDDRRQFTITSDWADEDCFRMFEVSPWQHATTAALRRLRRSSTMRTEELRAVITNEGVTT